MSINTVVLTGRLTATPEVKTTQSDLSVCSFTVAVDRPYKSGGERQADFINCVAWRSTAEFIGKYFKNGDGIGIVGKLQMRSYEDRDGNRRKAVEVVVSEVSFVGGRNTGNHEQESASSVDVDDLDDEDLPF